MVVHDDYRIMLWFFQAVGDNQAKSRLKIITSYLLLGVGLLHGSILFAQQLPQYSQWSAHQLVFNPAHAGIKPCMEFHTLYRMQWVGFDGNPRSGFIALSAPIPNRRKKLLSGRYGWGLKLESDRIGHFNSNRLNLAFAAHFNFSTEERLSLGMYAGVVQLGFDPSDVVTVQPDPTVNQELSLVNPDASFGAWWNGRNYYLGLSLQQLIGSRWDDLGVASQFRFHGILNGGYRQRINDALTLLPGAIIRLPPKGKISMDLQAMLDVNNRFNFGLGYRTGDAVIFHLGAKITPKFNVQYSFDATTSPLKNFSSNTHELSIVFNNCPVFTTEGSAFKCPLF
jgi:type IX secretion system PorP/SprF family membrane protein